MKWKLVVGVRIYDFWRASEGPTLLIFTWRKKILKNAYNFFLFKFLLKNKRKPISNLLSTLKMITRYWIKCMCPIITLHCKWLSSSSIFFKEKPWKFKGNYFVLTFENYTRIWMFQLSLCHLIFYLARLQCLEILYV